MNLINNHNGYSYRTHQSIPVTDGGHGKYSFNINSKEKGEMMLPFLYYRGVHYRCYLNDLLVKIHKGNHSLAKINDNHTGNANVYIQIVPNKLTILGDVVSLIGVLICILLLLLRIKTAIF